MYKNSMCGNFIIKINGNIPIPKNTNNVEYQEYLKWINLGNTVQPAETTAEKKTRLISENRNIRNSFLRESDIFVLPDKWDTYTMQQKSDWSIYRQTLRDWPANNTTVVALENPVWPVRPI